jgi:2-amino-4-hydroxy-6-hydroxymethyldihydropteridine diphosphokinase
MQAYLGVGSNLGDRWAHLRAAVAGLAELDPGIVVSPVYETAPVGGPAGQGPYLNCVVRVDTTLEPRQLLRAAQLLEDQAARVRRERFGPRTLDVDILLIEGFTSDDPELVVPHPRMCERAFVLAPLEDLDASRVPGDWHTRVAAGRDSLRRVGALLGPFVRADPVDRAGTTEPDRGGSYAGAPRPGRGR